MSLCCFVEAHGVMRNKIFFVYRIKGVLSDVGKPRGYFQSVKYLNLTFWGKNNDRVNDCGVINAFTEKLRLGSVEFKKEMQLSFLD